MGKHFGVFTEEPSFALSELAYCWIEIWLYRQLETEQVTKFACHCMDSYVVHEAILVHW